MALWATIYTDASWCPSTCTAGWAAWIRFDGGRLHYADSGLSVGSNHAEVEAIVHAVEALLTSPYKPRGLTAVGIKTDSTAAVNLLQFGAAISTDRDLRRLQTRFIQLCVDAKLGRKLTWVKGHSPADGWPAFLNGKVDRLAGEYMRARRDGAPRPSLLSFTPVNES